MRRACLIFVCCALSYMPVLAAPPPDEMPMYGGIAKTPEMLEKDRIFLEGIEGYGLSRPRASDNGVTFGWQEFATGRYGIAMQRFNQAWLLDPDNGDAFHGFAMVVWKRDHDAAQAEALFRQGLARPRQSPEIYLGFGRFLLEADKPAEAALQLHKAMSVTPVGPDTPALLTIALSRTGHAAEACALRGKITEAAAHPLRDEAQKLTAACR